MAAFRWESVPASRGGAVLKFYIGGDSGQPDAVAHHSKRGQRGMVLSGSVHAATWQLEGDHPCRAAAASGYVSELGGR
jgi:hypothetical protein